MSLDQRFNTVHEKLQQLLQRMNRLQKENERLKAELESAVQKEAAAQRHLEELQQQIAVLKLAAGEANEKDKKEFEKKINQYIREIDRCIAFLSQ